MIQYDLKNALPFELAYNLVHLSQKKAKITFPGIGKGKLCFPKKRNCVQFKKGDDSYRMGNRICTKSYADS
jgi:hypothetical protein